MPRSALHPLEFALQKYLQPLLALDKPNRLLVLVSGGRDSMVLLHALYAVLNCGTLRNFELAALHFNHERRGEESNRDEALVVQFCQERGISLVVRRWHEDFVGSENIANENFQALARAWRYRVASAQVAQFQSECSGCGWIVTGHHARDAVESMILHLVRGCGIAGLRGISAVERERCLLRPFVSTPVARLTEYVSATRTPFVDDSSNFQETYDRNFVRLRILPLLEQLNPSYEEALLRLADSATEAWDTLQRSVVGLDSIPVSADTTTGEIVRFAYARSTELAEVMTHEVAENIRDHIRRKSSKGTGNVVVPLAKGWQAIVVGGRLSFEKGVTWFPRT